MEIDSQRKIEGIRDNKEDMNMDFVKDSELKQWFVDLKSHIRQARLLR